MIHVLFRNVQERPALFCFHDKRKLKIAKQKKIPFNTHARWKFRPSVEVVRYKEDAGSLRKDIQDQHIGLCYSNC